MGVLHQRNLSLAGLDISALDHDELRERVRVILEHKIHGICFSPYLPGQGPGTELSAEQIRQRLSVVAPYVRWVRTFSCTDGNELIPGIAKSLGLKTLVGVWLDDDRERNATEMRNALNVVANGEADILAVGNEVLLRDDLPETELIDHLAHAKAAAGDVPVGYVDAYFKFEDYPAVTKACDVVLANCYPFWEGCPVDHALLYMKEMYRRAVRVADGRKVIITETGWPNIGTATGGAQPSYANALKYFIDTCLWADDEELELFYFSSFDENWKVEDEGDVGAYWGLWDQDGKPKYA